MSETEEVDFFFFLCVEWMRGQDVVEGGRRVEDILSLGRGGKQGQRAHSPHLR